MCPYDILCTDRASGLAGEVDVLGLDSTGLPPGRRLIFPVQVRVRDDLVWRRRSPLRLIARRVSVADQGGVVSPDECAVDRRPDARIGLCTYDDEPSDSEARQHRLEGGVLE